MARALRRFMHMRRPAPGYTLIELMTVMAVLSILTGIAYLRLGPAFTRANVRSAANLIATDLQQAQMLAVRHRRPIVFEADVGAPRYDIRNRAGDTIYVDVPLGPGTEYPLDEFTAVPATLEFFPNGLSSADAAFTVGIGGYRRQVSLTRAGQIRISSAP